MTNYFVYGFNNKYKSKTDNTVAFMIKNIVNNAAAAVNEIKIAAAELNKASPKTTNSLERHPVQDVFVSSETNTVSKALKSATASPVQIANDYEQLKKEKLFNEEIMFLLQPKILANGSKSFTPTQIKIINLAVKKITFFKGAAKRLEKDGTETIDKVIKDIKQIFGSDASYGKYLKPRTKNGMPVSKEATSIYNKIIKEFNEQKIDGEVMNIFSKRLYQKPYRMLDKTEKELVKLSIQDGDVKLDSRDFKTFEKVLTTTKKDYDETVNWIKDLIGLRMVIPENADMNKAADYLTNAILKGKLTVTIVSNYHANHIYPYISQDTVKLWKQSVPGMELVQTSSVRKKNGYTTTQMNIVHNVKDKSGKLRKVLVELQLRSEQLNKIGQIEHLIYDILADKNIGKNIPELEKYYDSIGIKKAVKDVFDNPAKESSYVDYERAMYSWIRHIETKNSKVKYEKPILTEFGLGEYENLLSFEALAAIDEKAVLIKEKYGKNAKNL